MTASWRTAARGGAWLAACCGTLAAASAFVARAVAAKPSGAAPTIAATISPLAALASAVAGPGWTVKTIVPPGRSPHVFEPTPREVKAVAASRLVVTVGAGYDDWVARLAAACASDAAIHDAGLSIGIQGGEHDEAEGVLGRDPHWWLSPEAAARALAPLAERLAAIDPPGAAGYRSRAERAARELLELDRNIAAQLAPLRGRAFVSAHPAWVYFADRYGLRPVGSIEPVPGREPSPRQLLTLLHAARDSRVETVFTEPQFPKSAAAVIAREGNLRLEEVDPIGGVPGRMTYAELLLFNAAAFRRGLSAAGAL